MSYSDTNYLYTVITIIRTFWLIPHGYGKMGGIGITLKSGESYNIICNDNDAEKYMELLRQLGKL